MQLLHLPKKFLAPIANTRYSECCRCIPSTTLLLSTNYGQSSNKNVRIDVPSVQSIWSSNREQKSQQQGQQELIYNQPDYYRKT